MKQNKAIRSMPLGRSLALGATMSMVVTLIFAAVFAAMISAGVIGENMTGYISNGILLLAAVIGSLTGVGKLQEKKLYWSLGIAVIYFLLLLAMTALFFDGRYDRITVTSFVLFLGAIGGAILGKGKGSGSNLRKRKIRRR